MSLRERIENNITVWLLGTLLTGFLAGIGAYKAIIEIAQLKTISVAEYDRLHVDKPKPTKPNSASQSIFLSADDVVIVPGFNFALRMDGTQNYNPETHTPSKYMFATAVMHTSPSPKRTSNA